MIVKCKQCGCDIKVDENEYQPGEIANIECWKCGEENEVTIPVTAMPAVSSTRVQSSGQLNERGPGISTRRESNVANTSSDVELEKAKMVLEAERIKLEHRKMEHEEEMKRRELELRSMAASNAPDSQRYAYQVPEGTKSKTTAGVLGILLGGVGAHKFYLGKTGMGVLYLLFCWTYIPGIIGLIEGIRYLCQSDVDFARKYG